MVIKLTSSFGTGSEIETKTPSLILQEYIQNNWPVLPADPLLPKKADIDFGAHPNRTNRSTTLRVYPVIYMENMLLGGQDYQYRVPLSIDIYLRDGDAESERREPTSLVKIQLYLREFLSINRLGLRNKGINNMVVTEVNPLGKDPDVESGQNWWHTVVTVVANYWMRLRDV